MELHVYILTINLKYVLLSKGEKNVCQTPEGVSIAGKECLSMQRRGPPEINIWNRCYDFCLKWCFLFKTLLVCAKYGS
jgi:hypothetical protein